MKHGTDCEKHGIATILGVIIPLFYSGCTLYEEGAYFCYRNGEKFIAVSPDGSIRNKDGVKCAVEIKCPTETQKYCPAVHYSLPLRYSCQVLAEMEVLGTQEALYISWTSESTTAFKVKHDHELFERVLDEVKSVYYCDIPKRPSAIPNHVKELKRDLQTFCEKNVTFVGEFQSLKGVELGVPIESSFVLARETPHRLIQKTVNTPQSLFSVESVLEELNRSKRITENVYNLIMPKASEVLAFTMSDSDRLWDPEIAHGLPIGYVLRGWSLSINVMRKIANHFHQKCHDEGIHVPCETFDGQWSQLMTTSHEGGPLTIIQLQRNVWKRTCEKKKSELIQDLESIGSSKSITYRIVEERNDSMSAEVSFQNTFLRSLRTSVRGWDTVRNRKENQTAKEKKEECAILESALNTLEPDAAQQTATLLNDSYQEDNIGQNENFTTSQLLEDDRETDNQGVQLGEEEQKQPSALNIELTDNDITIIQNLVVNGKRKTKWELKSKDEIKRCFSSATSIKGFTDAELKEILAFLNVKLRQSNLQISLNIPKYEKVNKLSKLLGDSSTLDAPTKRNRNGSKKILSLKMLSLRALRKSTYPKMALAIAHAECFWDENLQHWRDEHYVADTVEIENTSECFSPFYYPEFHPIRKQLEVKGVDGTHIRTCLRAKICRTGLKDIKTEAWIKVAKSRKTPLKLAALLVLPNGKVIEQQNEAFARTMFCEEVEREMRNNGDVGEAQFCRLIREWEEAEDKPGISAHERIMRVLNLRKWLLDSADFSIFPPPGMYIKGIPKVTFESLLCNLEGHMYMYELVKGGSYCWRAYSSLIGESFFSEMTEMDPAGKGVYTASGVAQHMKRTTQIHSMRLSPNRSFHMQTTESHVYPRSTALTAENKPRENKEPAIFITKISPLDHFFDSVNRKSHKQKPLGTISDLENAPKGVQPVRVDGNYKIDESKILHSLRLGINF